MEVENEIVELRSAKLFKIFYANSMPEKLTFLVYNRESFFCKPYECQALAPIYFWVKKCSVLLGYNLTTMKFVYNINTLYDGTRVLG